MSLQNRLNDYQYEFGLNGPWSNGANAKELCGYYSSNI